MAKSDKDKIKESSTLGRKKRPKPLDDANSNEANNDAKNNPISNLDEELNSNNNNNSNNNSNIDIKALEQSDSRDVYVEDTIHESEGLKDAKINPNVSEDDLFQMPPEDVNLEQDIAIQNNSENLTDINDDIPDLDFDPLQQAVKERAYTTGKIGDDKSISPEVEAENAKKLEEKIEEPEIKNPTYNDLPPKEEKKKNTGGDGNKNDGGGNNNGGGKNDNEFDTFEPIKDDKKKETANEKLDDLSPAQKRKAAEKAADAILLSYQKFVPQPFKAMSSFNMRKLQIMEMKNEISLDVECFDDGTTIKKYCEGVNQQVEETFVITDEMKQEIKDPLVDVLLENNLALTPTQRLLMAVGGQVVQMTITAVGFMNQNKSALSEFKRFHQESMELKRAAMSEAEIRFSKEQANSNNNSNNRNNNDDNEDNTVNQNPKKTPPQQPKNEAKNEPVNKQEEQEDDDIPNSDANEDVPNFEETTSDSNIEDAKIQDEQIDVKQKDPSLDDYILTEENGGITVEIEENKPDDIGDF